MVFYIRKPDGSPPNLCYRVEDLPTLEVECIGDERAEKLVHDLRAYYELVERLRREVTQLAFGLECEDEK